jgi:hypothetical protein
MTGKDGYKQRVEYTALCLYNNAHADCFGNLPCDQSCEWLCRDDTAEAWRIC